MYIPVKIATDYGTNLSPEKLKAATQNEQNGVWLVVNNRPLAAICSAYPTSCLLPDSGH
jgi:hypothetical protein